MVLHCYSIREALLGNKNGHEVYLVDHSRIQSLYNEIHEDADLADGNDAGLKRKSV